MPDMECEEQIDSSNPQNVEGIQTAVIERAVSPESSTSSENGADDEYVPEEFSGDAPEAPEHFPTTGVVPVAFYSDRHISVNFSSLPRPTKVIRATEDDKKTEIDMPDLFPVDVYGVRTPDLDELRLNAEVARIQRNVEKEAMQKAKEHGVAKIGGIGTLIGKLRGNETTVVKKKPRLILGRDGVLVPRRKLKCTISGYAMMTKEERETLELDLPPPPDKPSNPEALRKLVRSKMIRCKVCGSRFGEKNLLERHLRDRHHVEYLEYIYQQELEVQQQREEEAERTRLEELTTGGFIPPQYEIEAGSYEVVPEKIPLPGELSNGIPARFDANGLLHQPKRPYKKKVSPQCPFCDKRFRNEISLKKHIVKKHPECAEFVQCLDCFKCLPTKSDLADHMCDMTWLCVECTPIRNMCTESRLVMHRLKFHRGSNSGFKCHECNMKFLTPRKLRKHKKMAHVFVKTYACHFCEELFTSEVSVVTHERMHTGIIKFECKICDFKANRFIEMEEHKKEEHGYLCSICQAKFSEWSEIKNHTLREHGGYLTSECNAGYIECPRVWVMMKGD